MKVAAIGVDDVAEQAECTKCMKDAALESKFYFVAVAIETSGVFGPKAFFFSYDLRRCLQSATQKAHAHHDLFQQIFVVIQWSNFVAVLGSVALPLVIPVQTTTVERIICLIK